MMIAKILHVPGEYTNDGNCLYFSWVIEDDSQKIDWKTRGVQDPTPCPLLITQGAEKRSTVLILQVWDLGLLFVSEQKNINAHFFWICRPHAFFLCTVYLIGKRFQFSSQNWKENIKKLAHSLQLWASLKYCLTIWGPQII